MNQGTKCSSLHSVIILLVASRRVVVGLHSFDVDVLQRSTECFEQHRAAKQQIYLRSTCLAGFVNASIWQ